MPCCCGARACVCSSWLLCRQARFLRWPLPPTLETSGRWLVFGVTGMASLPRRLASRCPPLLVVLPSAALLSLSFVAAVPGFSILFRLLDLCLPRVWRRGEPWLAFRRLLGSTSPFHLPWPTTPSTTRSVSSGSRGACLCSPPPAVPLRQRGGRADVLVASAGLLRW